MQVEGIVRAESASEGLALAKVGERDTAPFLKWAGGKRWLCRRFPHLLPKEYTSYVEPFLGSASVFFHIKPVSAKLSDANGALIETYLAIRDEWKTVETCLREHENLHSDDYYYIVRSTVPCGRPERAARFLYLNRTCWNGLYRVNKSGIFNVPRGTKNSIILPSDDFRTVSLLLQNADIESCDFEETLESAGPGSFCFIDPPYTVAHNLNGFVKYNDKIFTWDDQVRLSNSVKAAISRGAKVLITNADHRSIRELYLDTGTHITLERPTIISGSKAGRKLTTELAIVGGYTVS